jgi:cell division protein FtsL
MLLLAALAASLGVYIVSQRHQMIQTGYRLSEISADLRALREENRRLRLEKSVLTHPERIERLARAQGMQLPDGQQTRVIGDSDELAAADRK